MPHYLLDTHTLIWFLEGDEMLSAKAKSAIEGEQTVNFVSIMTLWEIAIKISLVNKLELKTPFSEIDRLISENGFQILPITFEDTKVISGLPFYHRDPFDRMLIAQAQTNDLTLISKDGFFPEYGVKLLW